MLTKLYKNHVFANLSFILVLLGGIWAYNNMAREHTPSINFNWVQINTKYPGASAEDVEKLVTEPLEDAVRKVQDLRFSSSNSQEGLSSILIRFRDLDAHVYDKRITDLRREVQNKANNELPQQAENPEFFELTSASMLPAAVIMVSGIADDEVLRKNAQRISEDLERIPSVETVGTVGLRDPEIHVEFIPERLQGIGVTPVDLANTVSDYFKDLALGSLNQRNQQWLIRLIGTSSDLKNLSQFPINTASGQTNIGSVAEISREREKPVSVARYDQRPGVLLVVSKKANTSVFKLISQLKQYIDEQNLSSRQSGVELVLIDDQTPRTKAALRIMENNAVLGLFLVMLMTWVFLGLQVSFFIGIGIPFTLAGTFLLLHLVGESLNISVLLGIVLVLGMLVDDAVVIVESIYFQIQRGVQGINALIQGLAEVAAPVFTSVLTTIAAFLPLLLTPGLLGEFMFVIPLVVTIALSVSLIEAYWILPVHMSGVKIESAKGYVLKTWRSELIRKIKLKYCKYLVVVLRNPKKSLCSSILVMMIAIAALKAGLIRVDFFADDPVPLFYINVEMPSSAPLSETQRIIEKIDAKLHNIISSEEIRHTAGAAGVMFTDSGVVAGEHLGAIIVTLNFEAEKVRTVNEIIESVRAGLVDTAGPTNISFLRIAGGPPVTKPIVIKVRGQDLEMLRKAVSSLENLLASIPGVLDITHDDVPGKLQLKMNLDGPAIKRANLTPETVTRTIRLLFDGEVVASMQDKGEKVEVRVLSDKTTIKDIDSLLRQPIALPHGGEITLGKLINIEKTQGQISIKHYNFRRTITVEANIDKQEIDTVTVNNMILEGWRKIGRQYPGINLDFSGVFEDIQESMQALIILFIFGMGLIYIILGTQFHSYWQPFLILTSVPMAFTGVIFGLFISQNPLSLYTLYGSVALAGIAVNSAIVLIVAANRRLENGMKPVHATVYAARRRVIPILITSSTTIAGLFALATGLGGRSLLWGPVASAIVWGLAVSTILTLFLVPLLYLAFAKPKSSQ